jgi:hypothetical protein
VERGPFGANARGFAIVFPGITDAELKTLADGGVRGIGFHLNGFADQVAARQVHPSKRLSRPPAGAAAVGHRTKQLAR